MRVAIVTLICVLVAVQISAVPSGERIKRAPTKHHLIGNLFGGERGGHRGGGGGGSSSAAAAAAASGGSASAAAAAASSSQHEREDYKFGPFQATFSSSSAASSAASGGGARLNDYGGPSRGGFGDYGGGAGSLFDY
uniref:Uncharacterized protein n=1 Tax=Cacopsylla melanoneura TaxID=428564 RepID=A0A8D8QQE8_9HEMI